MEFSEQIETGFLRIKVEVEELQNNLLVLEMKTTLRTKSNTKLKQLLSQ